MAYYFRIEEDHCEISEEYPSRKGYTQGEERCIEFGYWWDFQLFDDDGNLYYTGIIWTIPKGSQDMFAPLEWAQADAGCTIMKVKHPSHKTWEIL